MSAKLLSRIIVVLVFGALPAFGMHWRMERRREAGREAFMTEQANRWERAYTHPSHLAVEMFVCVSGAALVFSAYELLAAGLCRTLRRPPPNETKIS